MPINHFLKISIDSEIKKVNSVMVVVIQPWFNGSLLWSRTTKIQNKMSVSVRIAKKYYRWIIFSYLNIQISFRHWIIWRFIPEERTVTVKFDITSFPFAFNHTFWNQNIYMSAIPKNELSICPYRSLCSHHYGQIKNSKNM